MNTNSTSPETAYGRVIHDQLITTISLATERAFLLMIEVVAKQAGITAMNGMSLHDFYHHKRAAVTEELIADFADVNPTAASHVKALWDQYHGDDADDSEPEGS